MKRRLLHIISLFLVFCFQSELYSIVVWNGNIDSTDSVLNDDLQITGNVTFTGASPITITINDGNAYTAIVTGDFFVRGNGSQVPLNIQITNGSFKFIVENDLTFRGDTNPFFMTAAGSGLLQFELWGGTVLRFDANPGAFFLVDMDSIDVPNVEFTRAGDIDQHVEVIIDNNSLIGFMAETPIASPNCPVATEEGVIRFVTGNTGVGRYVLRIKNRGGFVIEGYHKTGGGDTPNLNDLDRSTPAGRLAQVEVENNLGPNNPGSLLVINENRTFSQLLINPFGELGGYTGVLYGFIIGANGELNILDNAYLDYVGTTRNRQPKPLIPEDILAGKLVTDVVQERNASAMIIDGFSNACASTATIRMDGTSAVYFRSGVDAEGNIAERTFDDNGNEIFSFVVDFKDLFDCQGNIVLDVEGALNVFGSGLSTALNILSLEVGITGGTVAIGDTKKIFPLRTFEEDMDGNLLRYNLADFFINNRMNLFDTVLKHDDENHKVFENNSPQQSQPAYRGGESHLLFSDDYYLIDDVEFKRPRIVLYNSRIDLHTSAAFMGVDISVPNLVDCDILKIPNLSGIRTQQVDELDLSDADLDEMNLGKRVPTCECPAFDNVSALRFFYNGYCLDNGTGRQLILGTNIFCNCKGLTDCDAHLDIMQEFCQDDPTEQQLRLEVAANDDTIIRELAGMDIQGQFSINTIYLGCSSNITIGTDGDVGVDPDGVMFELTTKPTLIIAGDFFSFATQGGSDHLPELSGTTGEGAIFVDANGTIKILNKRAIFSTMVVRSHNGVIDLPRQNVLFAPRVGVTNWRLDLSDPDQRVIVKPGESYSNYTIDWINVCKDVCDSVTELLFDPFEPPRIPECECDSITPENIFALPTIEGEVDQFQVKRSRLGWQVNLKVDGTNSCNALIRELIFLTGYDSAEAPVGLIVLTGNARVGLGSANRYVDSTQTTTILGINGITIVPDGNGTIDLNEDLIINNICHIMPGPNFGIDPETGQDEVQRLTFCSTTPKEVRVRGTGVLDLTKLNDFQIVSFAGSSRLVLEPGARIRFNPNSEIRGTLEFLDTAQFRFECGETICPFGPQCDPTATDVNRAKISGTGQIAFLNDASMRVLADTVLGIESDPECAPQTDILLSVFDNAQVLIGPEGEIGGAVQVGNTTEVENGSVIFELLLDGLNASFQINSEGYFGIGAGINSKPSGFGTRPSDWQIGALKQVTNAVINIVEGNFQNNIIQSSAVGLDDVERPAGLLALGPVVSGVDAAGNDIGGYRFIIQNLDNLRLLGGGNMFNIGADVSCVATVVEQDDGLISGSVAAGTQVQAGTLSSLDVFLDNGQTGGIRNQVFPNGITVVPEPSVDTGNLTSDVLFGILKTPEITLMQQARGNIAINSPVTSAINYTFNSTIVRALTKLITGRLGVPVDASLAQKVGTVGIGLNPNNTINIITLVGF